MRLLACLLMAALLAPVPAAARGCMPRVRDAWIRLTPGGAGMLAGYARIENPCRAAAVVTGARSAAFRHASVHETVQADGMSRMRALPRLVVPPRGAVLLAPAGKHLMLMAPLAPLKAGGWIDVVFELEDRRELKARFELRPPSG